jgi:hypothetical protein
MTLKTYSFVLIALLLAGMVAVPCVSAANETNPKPPGWVGKFDEWAGQKDMSRYNSPVTPLPIQTINATTARLYPNVTACGKDGCLKTAICPFPFLRCWGPLTFMVIYNVNETRPVFTGPVINVSISGEIFPEPVNLYQGGTPDIFLQFFSHSRDAP